ncbi:hypothetical protein LEP1GSC047_1463 [Leptospira inadai serovar Lyme str. 10]|uniref:Uncharacterized protein n=1 Tax=Leptospira inadai serovar Lyme str. 10 TaxID=1049790 RepID=V6H848_9LEPT|nr:hypothetical protein LEP1GSC047_1463 [Leptospira inadai serovar Lyme str. 10]
MTFLLISIKPRSFGQSFSKESERRISLEGKMSKSFRLGKISRQH